MELCLLCFEPARGGDCWVRLEDREVQSCRRCWEQVFLHPQHVLDVLKRSADGASPAASN